jgi:acetylcholinesterase/cholinesterase
MVFVPGGRFEQGASGTVLYNSEYLVNTSRVISVSINYRLGALGFLVAQTDSGFQANLGIIDQRLALQFVQDNIANFGGDPTRVTLFGQSAGATSTGIHLTSPASWNYFSQVIMESFPLGLTLPDFELSKKLSQRFSEDLGCGSDLKNLQTCIVTKSIPEILAAQVSSENVITPLNPLFIFMPWQPTVDGTIVENSVLTAVYNGIYKKSPCYLGYCRTRRSYVRCSSLA